MLIWKIIYILSFNNILISLQGNISKSYLPFNFHRYFFLIDTVQN